ncbi:MAG: NCS2 family permease [Planctomycetota bacterium]
MGFLERRFGLREAGTTVRTEVAAGATTFVTLSYILFVQPAVLSDPVCGMDPGGVLFATCVASAVACFLMALWANYPIALAPAMGHNFFFVFAVCGGMGFSWREALAANLLAGLAFLALAGLRLRERVLAAIPPAILHAIGAGIGLLIAFVGLQWSGIIVGHPAALVQLGDLGEPSVQLALLGLLVSGALLVRGVPGALLIGALATAACGALVFGLVELRGVVGAPPAPSAAFGLDFAALFARPWSDWLTVLLIFFALDLFDSVGTLVGVAGQAGLLRGGKLPRARGAFAADAAGTSLGALLGTSTITCYVESSAGVASGGRTGLTAATTGVLLLAALFFAPLFSSLAGGVPVALPGGGEAIRQPVLAPALVLVGALMMRSVREIDWDDRRDGIAAFLTLATMMLTLSISDGIAAGFLAYAGLSLLGGRAREASLGVYVLAGLFLLRYLLLP